MSQPQPIPARCAVGLTAELIGGKWKSVILYFLMRDGTLRFGQIRTLLPGITQRMLTLQLRELEADGLVHRRVHPVVPPHVDYTLTEFGTSLAVVLNGMHDWGQRYKRRCQRAIEQRAIA